MAAALRGVVALDGPSGTGKSTAARGLASRLGARYLDTGAMYRAVTLAVLRAGVDPADEDSVAKAAVAAELDIATDPLAPAATLGGQDVAAEIRGPEVTAAVSAVSAVPAVRRHLVELQRKIIAGALAEPGGIVVEGRDIGTVVAPDAGLKVYLTADADIRAARRTAQDSAEGRRADHGEVRAAVERRDRLDSERAADPMRPADDAIRLDTTELGFDEVLSLLSDLVAERELLAGALR